MVRRCARILCTLAALDASSVLAAGREQGHALDVQVTPGRIVLGGDGPQRATVDVVLPEASARAGLAGMRLETTAGTITDLHPLGGARFRATLEPPAERFPQIAVVTVAALAAADDGAPPDVAVAVLAFAARIELKGTSEPRARMRVDLGGKVFGPVQAEQDGKFAVPIVVEPGQGWAKVVAVDPLGNASRSRVSLYLPAVRRLQAYVFPEVLVADGGDTGWIYATSLGRTGAPVASALEAWASRGSISLIEHLSPGLVRLAYRAPAQMGPGYDEVSLAVPGWGAPAVLKVPLVAGRPQALAVTAVPAPAPADGVTRTRVRIVARDRAGNPAAGHRASVSAGGERHAARELEAGVYESELPAREAAARLAGTVLLEPEARQCPRPRAVLAGGVVGVVDRRGVACTGELAAVDASGRELWRAPAGGAVPATLGAEDLLVLTDSAGERHVVAPAGAETAQAPALEQPIELTWRVAAPVELRLVVVERHGRGARVKLLATGIDDVRARARVEASGAEVSAVAEGKGYVELEVRPASAGAVDVVAVDPETGVSAWLRLD